MKIPQFEPVVMTEKNAFVHKLFLSLNISDFSESYPPLSNLPLKVEVLSSPSPFLKIWLEVHPPFQQKWGAHYDSPALLNFFLLMLVFVGFPFIGKFWSCCCLIFHWLSHKLQIGCAIPLCGFLLLLCLLGCSSWSCENSVLLLLLVKFVSGFRLELMYISLIISIRSNHIYLYGFQQLVLLG